MTKGDFLKELEYMLQDVAEDEREEALQYYQDYLEDAGPEEEEAVLCELGSPARVAAMIKAGLNGTDQGEFSENGYGDPRYNGPVYPVGERAKRTGRDFDRAFRKDRRDRREEPFEPDREDGRKEMERRPWVVVLILILCLLAAPVVLGLGGGLLGVLLGLAGVMLGLFVSVGALTLGLLIGGVVSFIVGVVSFFYSPVRGFLGCFAGAALIGLGLLVLAFAIWFYGSALPAIVRSVCSGIHALFRGHSKGGDKTI